MNKIALFIIAGLLATSVMSAAIAGCLIPNAATDADTNKCLLCINGKDTVRTGAANCDTNTTSDCQIKANAEIFGIQICDLCSAKDKYPTIDNKCVALNGTVVALTAVCSLKTLVQAGTSWRCLGCSDDAALSAAAVSAGTTKLTIDNACIEAGLAEPTTTPVSIGDHASKKTCAAGQTITSATACTATTYGAASTIGKNAQAYFDGSMKYYYSSNITYAITGAALTGTLVGSTQANCWLVETAASVACLKCRPGFKTTYMAKSDKMVLEVACAALPATATAASGSGSGKECLVGYKALNGTEYCHTCVDSTGAYSAPNITNQSCAWASANNSNNSNNSNQNTNSSILGFSVAAFLLLIINRLF